MCVGIVVVVLHKLAFVLRGDFFFFESRTYQETMMFVEEKKLFLLRVCVWRSGGSFFVRHLIFRAWIKKRA